VNPSGDGQSRRASGRLARSARALAASWRRRATARATPVRTTGDAKPTAEDERVMISRRFDAARERLKASIAPPSQEDDQLSIDETDQLSTDETDQRRAEQTDQLSIDETDQRRTGEAPPPTDR
jgi:hypothetical protein